MLLQAHSHLPALSSLGFIRSFSPWDSSPWSGETLGGWHCPAVTDSSWYMICPRNRCWQHLLSAPASWDWCDTCQSTSGSAPPLVKLYVNTPWERQARQGAAQTGWEEGSCGGSDSELEHSWRPYVEWRSSVFQSHSRWRVFSLKTLELISWYQYLFKFVSGLLLTFTSNTIVEGLWKPTEKLEWTPTISWSGYNLYPVRNGLLKVHIHFHF